MTELSDKEITEACARARSLLTNVVPVYEDGSGLWCYDDGAPDTTGFFYNPLTDRAQAMEIQERLKPTVSFSEREGKYRVSAPHDPVDILDANLLRAICLCDASVQIEKEKNANG